ncbi:glycosyl transferase [Microbotryomycetes sp. JL221]|nr:glycosyl transferase [Microbotryomycetes sp. JL221]
MSAAGASTTSRRVKPPSVVGSSRIDGTRGPSHSIPPVPPIPHEVKPRWTRTERDFVLAATIVKVLLFDTYRSTDFEVHRNWLAITHSLPLSKWYFDTTSQWTLDYPPFFAFFERVLSMFAYVVDPQIVNLDNLQYEAKTVILFQRLSVIVSEFVLVTAVLRWARTSTKPDYQTALVIAASLMFHPGLIIVDHIHFQYNGFLLGILLWSLIAAQQGNLYLCAALFATLLNFKHIFVYLAPPFFVFLLKQYCFRNGKFSSDRLIELGLLVIAICGLSFGPFVVTGGIGQLKQIMSRLFPFQRGLNHAYWAGNVWALVTALDRFLVKYLTSRGWPVAAEAVTSASRGLIGDTTFGVLPTITPRVCFSIVLGFTLIFMTKLWFDPTFKRFLDSVILSAMTSFLFGWHVHEKAALLFLVPLSLTAAEDQNHLRAFIVASTAGIYALFPLLIKPNEGPIKLLVSGLWAALVFPALSKVVYRRVLLIEIPLPSLWSVLISFAESAYLLGFIALHIYVEYVHEKLFPTSVIDFSNKMTTSAHCALDNITCIVDSTAQSTSVQTTTINGSSMQFLPLLLTSVYCAVGICWSWLRLSWVYVTT